MGSEIEIPDTPSAEDLQRLTQSLQMHQIELQLQNDELRRTQHELEVARNRYFDFYNLSPVGYLTLSKLGLIQEVNLTCATLLGRAKTGLINRPLSVFIHPADQDMFSLYHKMLLTKSHLQTWDMRLLHADGSSVWMYVHANRNQDGECNLTLIDITKRKYVDEMLSFLVKTRSDVKTGGLFFTELARYLAQSLEMDFVCIDRLEGDNLSARTVAVWCDGHFEDNVTYTLKDTPCGDVVGKIVCSFPANVCQLFPHDQMLRELRAESYVGVTLWNHSDHPIGQIAVISRKPLKNPGLVETILKMVAVHAAGELERLENEATLRLNEEQHRTILQTTMDGFLLMDRQGRLLEVNETYCRMSGYSEQELLTMRVSDLEAMETEDVVAAHIRSIAAKGENRFETRHRRKDGSIFDVEVSAQYRMLSHWMLSHGLFVVFMRDITARKRVEKELLENNRFLDTLLEAIPVPIFFKDRNGCYLGFNKAYEEFFGKGREELIGKSVFEIAPMEMAEIYHAKDNELLSKAGSQVYESQVRDAKGAEHAVIFHKAAFLGQTGEVSGLVGAILDITERKQAELDRKLNNKRLELLLELNSMPATMDDEIFHYTLEAVRITVQSRLSFIGFLNEAETVITIHECSNEIMSHSSVDNFPRSLPIAEAGLWRECVRQRAPLVINDNDLLQSYTRGYPAGQVSVSRFLAVPVFDGDRIVAIAAAANNEREYTQSDVNALTVLMEQMFNKFQRKRAKEALLEANQFSEQVIRCVRDGIIVYDLDLRFRVWNPAMEYLSGVNESEVLGGHPAELFPFTRDVGLIERLEKVLAGETPDSIEFPRPVIQEGMQGWSSEQSAPLRNIKGDIIGAISTVRDITWRKQMEDELRQALEAATAVNETMSRLLLTVAHEFRTPLGLITGSNDILDRYWDRLTPELRLEQSAQIRNASRQLAGLVNTVTGFNQLGANSAVASLQLLEIGDYFRVVVKDVETVWSDGHECTISIASNCGKALLDEVLLRRVLENLLTNAFRYTPAGGTVAFSVCRENGRLLLEIGDTGIGIPEEDQKLIFDAFYRCRNVESRRGIGLGLSIVHDALSQLGGAIAVTSRVGEGTIMKVEIPVDDTAE